MVAVFGSSRAQPGDPDYMAGVRCGRLLAEAGCRVATGGYGGLMEAVSRGAAEAGGTVIAATAPELFPRREGANAWAHREAPQPTLPLRLAELIDSSVATIALPGSLGTFTELMVAWNVSYIEALAHQRPRPVIAVGRQWEDLLRHVAASVGGLPELVTRVASVDDAVAAVLGHLSSVGGTEGP